MLSQVLNHGISLQNIPDTVDMTVGRFHRGGVFDFKNMHWNGGLDRVNDQIIFGSFSQRCCDCLKK